MADAALLTTRTNALRRELDPGPESGTQRLESAPRSLKGSLQQRIELIEAGARGDRAAAHALTLELMPRVRNLVRYLTRSGDIDDVTQEALVSVLRSLPSYKPTGSFNAWVDCIVVRVTYAELRRRRRGALHDSIEVDEVSASTSDFATVYATRARIVEVLDALPVDQRFAVVLHHVLGMSVPEIAEEMGAPLETIRSRLRLGMQQLRRSMGANEGDR